jgi:hypothetical protein
VATNVIVNLKVPAVFGVPEMSATIIPVAAAAIVTVFKVNPSGRLPDVIW